MNLNNPVSIVVTVGVAAVTLAVVVQAAGIIEPGTLEENHQRAAEWCDQYEGELGVGESTGYHAQLHCYITNGESVHMGEIRAMNYTHNWSRIDQRTGATHANTPFLSIERSSLFAPFLISMALAGVVCVVSWFRR